MFKKSGLGLKLIIFITFFVIYCLTFFTIYSTAQEAHDKDCPSSTSPKSVAIANNQVAIELYNQLKAGTDNIFISPYSLSSVMAMVYEGARGDTAEEIQSVFHFCNEKDLRRSSFASMDKKLVSTNEYTLNTANAIWVDTSHQLLNSYSDDIKAYYGGKVENINFRKNPEKARKTINNWFKNNTQSMIKELFPKGTIDNSTELVLANTIYFKGSWAKAFDKRKTNVKEFHISDAEVIQTPLMDLTGANFNYVEDDNVQVLELPFQGNKLSMLFLLPKRNLSSLESILSLENLQKWKDQLFSQKVDVVIPKIDLNSKYFMKDTLSAMGMPISFSTQADFGLMFDSENIAIQEVIHQAALELNEEGAKASAASGVGMVTMAVPQKPATFKADHPFIFIIQEKTTDNILFIGRIINPNIK